MLTGALTRDSVVLRRSPMTLSCAPGSRAVAPDTAQRAMLLAEGSALSYDGLVVATGSATATGAS